VVTRRASPSATRSHSRSSSGSPRRSRSSVAPPSPRAGPRKRARGIANPPLSFQAAWNQGQNERGNTAVTSAAIHTSKREAGPSRARLSLLSCERGSQGERGCPPAAGRGSLEIKNEHSGLLISLVHP
jgi:hypothetical protein